MQNQLRILVVEDDHLQAAELRRVLEQELSAVVETVGSEYEFRTKFETIATDPPDLAILDRMVWWAIPDKNTPDPPEDARNPEQAGIRCARLLESDQRTKGLKAILYSVLGDDNIEGLKGVVKQGEFDNLISEIREALGQST